MNKKKLDEVFLMNPLYESDGYKVGHKTMLAENTVREYWTWIPRSLKYMHPSIDKIMSSHQQMVWRYIHSHFQQLFFNKSIGEALKFSKDMSDYLMQPYNGDHFSELHRLGYLPVKIQALPEGTFTNPNVPHMAGINTVDGYAWLGLFLETLVSKLAWQGPTTATIAHKFKQNAVNAVNATDSENLWLADFMCHDFSSRGGNPFTSIAVGLGHAMSNSGSDTLNVIPASRYYYDFPEDKTPIYSVNASEHSVTCTGIFFYENKLKKGQLNNAIYEYYSYTDIPCEGSVTEPDYRAIAEWLNLRDWLKKFPTGMLSVVSDTFDLWKLITFILPRLKDEILLRDGKLVIRPDSGDPVDIICGNSKVKDNPNAFGKQYDCIEKGVIQLLHEIFGGDKSKEGYIRLNSHIGAIYGDSINLERQVEIYEKLTKKGFAATNIVLGVGSFSYVYITRDQAGYAAKGAWFEIKRECDKDLCEGEPICEGTKCNQPTYESFNIFKDPVTDNGTKKSLKGFQFVNEKFEVIGEVSEEVAFSDKNMLKVIYCDGKFYNQTTLDEIRKRLN